MNLPPQIDVLLSSDWKDYELIDSGEGQKLERFGKYLFVRPEAQAVWQKGLPPSRWEKVDAVFQTTGEENGGHWLIKSKLPERWALAYNDLKCWVQPTASRHLGVFPEQATHWDWTQSLIQSRKTPAKILNLFGYTGLASMAAAFVGAQVTHVDASKKAIAYAKENQILCGLTQKPIRWIVDDALKFTEREARRGSYYDGIILDPPKFGRGPKGEVWEFFDLLPDLLAACGKVLTPQPLFLLMTAYAIKSSALTLHGAISDLMTDFPGTLTVGELATRESSQGRLISHAIYARWSGLK